ncbi:MAG: hypothetical protein RLZZ214_2185 [Verrucomicrobiota bacterium]|jgi:hypothetical protein
MIYRTIIFILLAQIGPLAKFVYADTPVLTYPQKFTWRGVFDCGLRPKHHPGLERKKTECIDQGLTILTSENGEPFKLDSGRLSIELMHDNRIRLLMHISRVPIAMEEGKRRQDLFRSLVQPHLTRTGSMPVIMDEKSGAVMATSDNSVTARMKNLRISYGFTPSFQKAKPLIPILMISTHPAIGEDSPPIRRKIVEPPAGYEWYSLDPKVSTPDPGSTPETLPAPEVKVPEKETLALPKVEAKNIQQENPKTEKDQSRLGWWIGLFCLLLVVMVAAFRKFGSGIPKPK